MRRISRLGLKLISGGPGALDSCKACSSVVRRPVLNKPFPPCRPSSRSLAAGQGPSHEGDKVVYSPTEPVEIPNVSVHEFLMDAMKRHGNNTAFIDEPTTRTVTYAQLLDAVVRVGSGLTRLGIRKGDVVSICALNSPEYVILCIAVASIGGVMSPINPLASQDDLREQLVDSRAKALVTFPEFVPLLSAIRSSLSDLKDVIVFGEADGCRPFSGLMADDGLAFPQNLDVDPQKDVTFMPYSSGTTGLPKGVMLTHTNLVANFLEFGAIFPTTVEDRMFCYLPLFHIYGLMNTLNSMAAGISVVTVPRFDPQTFIPLIEKHRITILNFVPPSYMFLAYHPAARSADLSSVRVACIAAAKTSSHTIAAFEEATGNSNTSFGYGLTECPVAAMGRNPADDSSTGVLLPNTAAKVVDLDDGRALGPGEDGEIWLKSAQVMAGYYNRPDSTAQTVVDGWLRTGDIGQFDEEGYLYIHDRLKELIKYKGQQVPPAQLESILLTHPGISDAAVVAVPDEEAGEVPRAFVVPAAGESPTEADIVQYVKERVAPFKQLRGGVKFTDQIPKSVSGKILRRELKGK